MCVVLGIILLVSFDLVIFALVKRSFVHMLSRGYCLLATVFFDAVFIDHVSLDQVSLNHISFVTFVVFLASSRATSCGPSPNSPLTRHDYVPPASPSLPATMLTPCKQIALGKITNNVQVEGPESERASHSKALEHPTRVGFSVKGELLLETNGAK